MDTNLTNILIGVLSFSTAFFYVRSRRWKLETKILRIRSENNMKLLQMTRNLGRFGRADEWPEEIEK